MHGLSAFGVLWKNTVHGRGSAEGMSKTLAKLGPGTRQTATPKVQPAKQMADRANTLKVRPLGAIYREFVSYFGGFLFLPGVTMNHVSKSQR